MSLHQGGQTCELCRGAALPKSDLYPVNLRKYLGVYRDEETGLNEELLVYNGCLAIEQRESLILLELYPSDEEGRWYVRLNPTVSVTFTEEDDGRVVSFTAHTPSGDFVRPRVEP